MFGWIRLDGFDTWLGFLDNELFHLRLEMQDIADQRGNLLR